MRRLFILKIGQFLISHVFQFKYSYLNIKILLLRRQQRLLQSQIRKHDSSLSAGGPPGIHQRQITNLNQYVAAQGLKKCEIRCVIIKLKEKHPVESSAGLVHFDQKHNQFFFKEATIST